MKTERPWGWYEVIDQGERFKVKNIEVKPGHRLSLQKHHHRAEHWIVVSGTAEVQLNDSTQIIGENQSTYVPLGCKHRLSNPGKIPLKIIEVQSGSYLEEDDIERIEDDHGRI
jgi:mannose-1-phosphate guanylyltransferase/mannose-6-phosphate isomerase